MSRPRSAALSLALLSLVAALPASAEIARLDPRVAPTFEAIELRIDAARTGYSGSVHVELDVKEAVSSFSFYAEGQAIERLELTAGVEAVGATWERGDDAIVTVTAARFSRTTMNWLKGCVKFASTGKGRRTIIRLLG